MVILIAIIDYGAGNLQSVAKALEYIGSQPVVSADRDEILQAEQVILPGVGSFGDCMENIRKRKLEQTILDCIGSGKPFLGICLGLQLLFESSDESPGVTGLGVLRGNIRRIPAGDGLKIPHMGWNSLCIKKDSGILAGLPASPYVYFVHSFYLQAENRQIVSSQTEYGVPIDASIEWNNVHAVQFHPEKSGAVGLQMLRNFAALSIKGE